MSVSVSVELLASPFCMADRDNETVGKICRQTGAHYKLLNMLIVWLPELTNKKVHLMTPIDMPQTGEGSLQRRHR